MRVNTCRAANRLFAMILLAFDIMVLYESLIFLFHVVVTHVLLREHFPVDKVPHKSTAIQFANHDMTWRLNLKTSNYNRVYS